MTLGTTVPPLPGPLTKATTFASIARLYPYAKSALPRIYLGMGAAMVAGLGAIGASVEELPDGWRVSPGTPRDARIATHGDHRIAIAFAVAALTGVASSVELDDPGCVAVSYPTFWTDVAAVTI